MTPLVTELAHIFSSHANPELAQRQQAYLQNKFIFFGITVPERRVLELPLIKAIKVHNDQELAQLIAELWKQPQRDFHYAAITLAQRNKKVWTPALLPTFEMMIRNHSWWDTVDIIASHCIGGLLLTYPELIPIMDTWIQDDHLWIRRTAIIFQLKWKQNTQHQLLFDYCVQRAHEKDFFIRKAIGWALREYSKTNSLLVRSFVDKHKQKLSYLSLKEAQKYI